METVSENSIEIGISATKVGFAPVLLKVTVGLIESKVLVKLFDAVFEFPTLSTATSELILALTTP